MPDSDVLTPQSFLQAFILLKIIAISGLLYITPFSFSTESSTKAL